MSELVGIGHKPQPVVRIRAGRRNLLLELEGLWQYRELLYTLTWREVKVRYTHTALGITWVLLQPFLTMVVFTIFFGRLAHIGSNGVPYPIFAYTGLLPWTFFSNAVTNAGNSLVSNSNLITKVYFPRLVIPGAAVGAALFDTAIATLLLVVLLLYYRIGLHRELLALPLLVVLSTLLALGAGTWTAAMNVKYRDIRYVMPFALQLWMFLTPIIYPPSLVPVRWRWLLDLNPMSGLVSGYRAAFLGLGLNYLLLLLTSAMTVGLLLYSVYTFCQMERSFADIV